MSRIVDEKLFAKLLRSAAKGTPWRAKQGAISNKSKGWVYTADISCRGDMCHHEHLFRFFAKPVAWDYILWDILQIEGNDKQPVTFHYWGWFTCKMPPICELSADLEMLSTDDDLAKALIDFAQQNKKDLDQTQGLSFDQMCNLASAHELRQDYTMTQVIALISNQQYKDAIKLCQNALQGKIRIGYEFSSLDRNEMPDQQGRRQSRSFFELAQTYLRVRRKN